MAMTLAGLVFKRARTWMSLADRRGEPANLRPINELAHLGFLCAAAPKI